MLWLAAMRAAFVTADVLAAAGPEPGATLRQLAEAGLFPVVLWPHPSAAEARPDAAGFPVVGCPAGDAACWGDQPELLLEAATVAGVAVALGIAFLLQDIYQTYRFPAISYYLTLQFIPQWLRGFLFILLGVGIGVMVSRLVGSMRARRRYGG